MTEEVKVEKKIDISKVKVSKLKVLDDQYDIKFLTDKQLFLARFLHDPRPCDMSWHVKQHFADLTSGKMERHGLSTDYWKNTSSIRPPICQKRGKSFVVLE